MIRYSIIISILFCAYSIKLLIDDKNKITYDYKDEFESDYDYRICLNLKDNFDDLFTNRSELNTINLKYELFDYLNEKDYVFRLLRDYQSFRINKLDEYKNKFKILILNKIELGDYFIYRDQVCLPIKKNENTIDYYNFVSMYKTVNYCVFHNETFNLINVIYNSIKISRLVVLEKPFPYTNCRPYYHRANSSIVEKYYKLRCLNDCYKKNFKLSKYFYTSDENLTIQLDYDDKTNRSIIENEQNCLSNECKEESCHLNFFIANRIQNFKISYYISNLLIPALDFNVQFIGLLSTFLNLSFYQIFSTIFKFLSTKYSNLKKFNLIFELIIIFIFSIFIIYYLFLYFLSIYESKYDKPNTKQILTMNYGKLEQFSLFICFFIKKPIYYSNPKQLIINRTFLSLENQSDNNYKNIIHDIYLEFGTKRQNLNYNLLKNKVYFKINHHRAQRCSKLYIQPNEFKYQKILSVSKLIIEYNSQYTDYEPLIGYQNPNINIYLVPENGNLNSESYESKPLNTFIKIEKKMSSENCLNYSKKYYDQLKCIEKLDCIEKCLVKNLFIKHSKILKDKIIDKQQFTDNEWETIEVHDIIDYKDLPYDIKYECENRFQIPNCFESNYQDFEKIKIYSNGHEINLYYNVIKEIVGQPLKNKLFLDMLNIQSILFGLNIFNLIIFTFSLFKFKLKNKNYLIFYYLICSIGCSIHLFFTIKEITYSELISQHYELQESIEMPEVFLCFKHEISTDGLTFENLDNLTNDLNTSTIFNKIFYLNNLNDWIELNETSNFKDDNFEIDTIYFWNRKCFNLKLNFKYNRKQFYFQTNDYVLRIKFDNSFVSSWNATNVLFFTKKKDAMYFSKLNYLQFYILNRYSRQRFEICNIIEEENFKEIYRNEFNLIKYPLSYLSNADANQYLFELIKNFRNQYGNVTTLNLPLENKNLTINDKLFEEYIKKIKVEEDKIAANSDYEKEETIHHLDFKSYSPLYHEGRKYYDNFKFKLIFNKRIIQITNEDNFSKLILSVLNIFSLWLGFNPFTVFVLKSTLVNKYIKKLFIKIDSNGSKEDKVDSNESKEDEVNTNESKEDEVNTNESNEDEIESINEFELLNRNLSLKDYNSINQNNEQNID